jgi:hypothetical protein
MGHDAEGLPSAPASFVNARLAEVTRTSLRASHVADAEMNRYMRPLNRDPRLNEASTRVASRCDVMVFIDDLSGFDSGPDDPAESSLSAYWSGVR